MKSLKLKIVFIIVLVNLIVIVNYLILCAPRSEKDSDDSVLVSDLSHPVEVIDDGEENQRMNDDRRQLRRNRRYRRSRLIGRRNCNFCRHLSRFKVLRFYQIRLNKGSFNDLTFSFGEWFAICLLCLFVNKNDEQSLALKVRALI